MKKTGILFLLTSIYVSLFGQTKDSIYSVTDNVYVITGYVCNISFLVTEDGVVLFDTGSEPDSGERILSLIRSVTDKPLKYIVLTHYHYDHVNGLKTLPNDIPIIAQKNEYKNIKKQEYSTSKELITVNCETDSLKKVLDKTIQKDGLEYLKIDSIYRSKQKLFLELSNKKYISATILVDSLKTVVVGKDTLEMFYPGKAHTDGDLVIFIKTKNVMVLGDLLFTKSRPYIDPLGDVQNWAVQLNKLADRNVKYYVPGHHQIAVSSDLKLLAAYFTNMYKAIGDLKKEGKTTDEIKKMSLLPAYDKLNFTFFRDQNIEAIYNQVK